jgi:hypothetical protein
MKQLNNTPCGLCDDEPRLIGEVFGSRCAGAIILDSVAKSADLCFSYKVCRTIQLLDKMNDEDRPRLIFFESKVSNWHERNI